MLVANDTESGWPQSDLLEWWSRLKVDGSPPPPSDVHPAASMPIDAILLLPLISAVEGWMIVKTIIGRAIAAENRSNAC
jgi:hypothetical protein